MKGNAPGALFLAIIVALALPIAGQETPLAAQQEQPDAEQPPAPTSTPYIGISLRNAPDGPVVSWVWPGPAAGSGIRRSDNLVSVNGQRVDADGFRGFIESLAVGDQVSLVLRRSPDANPDAAVPVGGAGGETFTVTCTLADRNEWTGTIGRGLGERQVPEPTEGEFEAGILEKAGQVGVLDVEGGVRALLGYLAGIQEAALDPNAPAPVINCFRRPLSVDAQERAIAELAARASSGELADIAALIGGVLEVVPGNGGAVEEVLPVSIRTDAESLVRHMLDNVYLEGESAKPHIAVINASRGVFDVIVPAALLRAAVDAEDWEDVGRVRAAHEPMTDLPEAVRAAVSGQVLSVIELEDGRFGVVGGPGPNTYDMGAIARVYDAGGDDVYRFRRADGPPGSGNHYIIDVSGNDTYVALDSFAGPGTAVLGLSLVDDRTGNDRYESDGVFSIGAGLFGVGIIIDHEGHDVYRNAGPGSGWAMGVGFYGAGLIIDRLGADTYLGEKLAQGVGGPRALGAIIDVAGNDIYRANGPNYSSVYGTPAVYAGFSQGFGMGVRFFAAGGVGAIYDLAGDDMYEAGEFSQAGGYYFGLGILHDVSGRDLYYGNRYGQAFAAHQAVGILIDENGDDTYWSKTAASQAGTWDQSIGLLVDRAGNDSYRCDGLGQGGASMQAVALLIDLVGSDRYTGGGATQGAVGSNTYHYDADKVFSLGLLWDRGGGTDVYSAGRENGACVATGSRNETDPQNSPLHGVFVDE